MTFGALTLTPPHPVCSLGLSLHNLVSIIVLAWMICLWWEWRGRISRGACLPVIAKGKNEKGRGFKMLSTLWKLTQTDAVNRYYGFFFFPMNKIISVILIRNKVQPNKIQQKQQNKTRKSHSVPMLDLVLCSWRWVGGGSHSCRSIAFAFRHLHRRRWKAHEAAARTKPTKVSEVQKWRGEWKIG